MIVGVSSHEKRGKCHSNASHKKQRDHLVVWHGLVVV